MARPWSYLDVWQVQLQAARRHLDESLVMRDKYDEPINPYDLSDVAMVRRGAYPETHESTIERRALDAAGQWAETATRLEAECQRLRERVAELEERLAALGRVPR